MLAAAALVCSSAVLGGAVYVPSVSAQTCGGAVSTTVESPTLPGGEWSVSNGCLPTDTFFEYSDGAVHAQAAISTVTYQDGHVGRVAVGMLTLGTGIGLAVVGVEDTATGLIKWSAVLGDYEDNGETASISGAGVTLLPTESAQLAVSITGTGTDVTSLVKGGVASTTTVVGAIDPTVTSTTAAPAMTTTTTTAEPSTTDVPTTLAPAPAEDVGAEPSA